MKFHLSAEQEALQDTVTRTALRACPPERRRAILEEETDFDATIWRALAEVGLGGLMIPEASGGAALGLEDAALAFEALGQSATPGSFAGHVLAGWAISQGGDDAVKTRWLEKLATGQAIAALALESGAPEDWSLKLSAGRLTGEVALAPGVDKADVIVVGVAGGLAMVETGPGLTAHPISGSDLTRRLWRLTFSDALATPIGDETLARRLADAALVLLAADALGGAEQCLSMAVDYAKQREQFGTVIGQFQALKHQLANMALEVEPARALVWYAAYAWDQEQPDSGRVAAHAKAHLADRFASVARMAVQAHGGIGYTWDYDLHIWFRRSLFDRAFLGAPSVHRARVAAMAGW